MEGAQKGLMERINFERHKASIRGTNAFVYFRCNTGNIATTLRGKLKESGDRAGEQEILLENGFYRKQCWKACWVEASSQGNEIQKGLLGSAQRDGWARLRRFFYS